MRKSLLLLWFVVTWVPGWAASPMVFRHLTVEDGLAQSRVNATLQDAKGFLWFATEDGLDRYDGYSFRHFRHVQHLGPGASTELAGNFVWALQNGRDGKLWVALKDAGVASYDPSTDAFRSFRHNERVTDSLANDDVRQILVARDGRIWCATSDAGISVLSPETGRGVHLAHVPGRGDSLSNNTVRAFAQDHDGRVWVGTDSGLDVWDPGSQQFRHFSHADSDPGSLASNKVSTLYVDRAGTLWVGTYDAGLSRFSAVTQRFVNYAGAKTSGLSSMDVRAILEDRDGRLWVGTTGGLNLLDRAAGTFSHYPHDALDPSSLRDDQVISLYQDRGGELWVGTLGGGASHWNPRSWLFGHVRPPWLAGAYAIAFADDVSGRVWVGTQGAGLFRYDPATGSAAPIEAVYGRRNLLPDKRIMSLLVDSAGNLWVGTMGSGLVRIAPDGTTRRLRGGRKGPHDLQGLGADGVMALCETRDGHIWVGTYGGGVSMVDARSMQILSGGALAPSPLLPGQRAAAIAQAPDGAIWVGTDGGGLHALRPDGTEIAAFRHKNTDSDSLSTDTIYAIYADANGRVWVGTDSAGLDLVVGNAAVPGEVHFRNWSTATGLSSNTVYGIQGDLDGALWLSGNRGLLRLNADSGVMEMYHREHGLQGEEFNFGAHFRLRDGRMVFGGPNGFNIFDPRRVIAARSASPPVALISVDLQGLPAKVEQPYPFLQRLQLDYRDNVLSFEFAALDFAAPEKNVYAYRLRGFDEDWVAAGTARRATYTNLNAGNYKFEVRAAAADGTWSDNPLVIPIAVQPAPWLSRTAYTLYAAGVAALLLAAYQAHRRRLARGLQLAARLENEVKERTAELQERNLELVRLTRAKSDFLARMSHEIRTPMNGIVGMTELIARTDLTPQQRQFTGTVKTSARALLRIINDILDLSKVEAGRIDIEAQPFDLNELLSEVAELFANQTDSKQVELIVSPAVDLRAPVVGDAFRIRQILVNLVGNAVKFTARGEIVLSAELLKWRDAQACVAIAVRDSGIGMPSEVIERVFEPFSQADESSTRRYGGTGLGLAICKELTERMGGSIRARSLAGAGSTFTLELMLPVIAASAAEAPPQVAGVDVGKVVVVTSRVSLADALGRQCALLGARAERVEPQQALRQLALLRSCTRVLVVDVDACQREAALLTHAWAESGAAAPDGSDGVGRLVLLGSPAALSATAQFASSSEAVLVSKPMRTATLRDLLGDTSGEVPGDVPADAPSALELLLADASPEIRGSEPTLRGHVLVVEDHEVNAAVAAGMLRELGCSCSVVGDGREAVARASSELFSAILMDTHMPGIDGLTATRLIRQVQGPQQRTPIIALTADPSAAHRRACMQAGMDDFLGKPVTLAELRATLARWLPVDAEAPERPEVNPKTPRAGALSTVALQRIAALERPGSTGLVQRVASLFVAKSAQQLDAIRQALLSGDLAVVRHQCHSLKSAAAHVGADGLARVSAQLEAAAVAADLSTARILGIELEVAGQAAAAMLREEIARRIA